MFGVMRKIPNRVLLALFLIGLPALAAGPHEYRDSTQWLGSILLDPQSHGISKRIDNIKLGQLFAGDTSLHASPGALGTLVLARDPDCPVSRAYAPRQAGMALDYQRHGFKFVVLYLDGMNGATA